MFYVSLSAHFIIVAYTCAVGDRAQRTRFLILRRPPQSVSPEPVGGVDGGVDNDAPVGADGDVADSVGVDRPRRGRGRLRRGAVETSSISSSRSLLSMLQSELESVTGTEGQGRFPLDKMSVYQVDAESIEVQLWRLSACRFLCECTKPCSWLWHLG